MGRMRAAALAPSSLIPTSLKIDNESATYMLDGARDDASHLRLATALHLDFTAC
jgi:hypothetical protein